MAVSYRASPPSLTSSHITHHTPHTTHHTPHTTHHPPHTTHNTQHTTHHTQHTTHHTPHTTHRIQHTTHNTPHTTHHTPHNTHHKPHTRSTGLRGRRHEGAALYDIMCACACMHMIILYMQVAEKGNCREHKCFFFK